MGLNLAFWKFSREPSRTILRLPVLHAYKQAVALILIELICASMLSLFCANVLAQELSGVIARTEDEASVDRAALAAIPEASEQGVPRLALGADNVQSFKNLIAPELYPLVKSGLLSMPIARALRYEWAFDKGESPISEVSSAALLKNDPAKEGLAELPTALPFGESKSFSTKDASKENAQKILWNMASQWWSQAILQMDLRLRPVEKDTLGQEIVARMKRAYPLAIGEGLKTQQLFRELWRFEGPGPFRSFAYLTFRFLNREEDVFWVFSPVISKLRQLTGTNKGDPLPAFVFALEDFLGWSGNIRFVDAELTAERNMILPFAELGVRSIKKESSDEKHKMCLRIDEILSGTRKAFVEWNAETRSLAGAVWLPSSAVYVPRKVWRMELASLDPYSLAGRQVLYVDQEAMLAPINVVFDRTGKLWKIILSGFGRAQNEIKSAPFQAFQVVYDLKENKATMLGTAGILFCDAFPQGESLADFDPNKLSPK